jgi:hypothetical protein
MARRSNFLASSFRRYAKPSEDSALCTMGYDALKRIKPYYAATTCAAFRSSGASAAGLDPGMPEQRRVAATLPARSRRMVTLPPVFIQRRLESAFDVTLSWAVMVAVRGAEPPV